MKTAQSVRFDNALTNASSNDPKDRDSSAHAEQNPILNALFSTDPVIEGFETIEDWNEHRDTVVQGLNPVGKLETLHAERAAMYLWRLDRVIRFEVVATQFDHNEVFAEFIVALDNKDIPRDRSEAATVEKVRKPLRDYLDEYAKFVGKSVRFCCVMTIYGRFGAFGRIRFDRFGSNRPADVFNTWNLRYPGAAVNSMSKKL